MALLHPCCTAGDDTETAFTEGLAAAIYGWGVDNIRAVLAQVSGWVGGQAGSMQKGWVDLTCAAWPYLGAQHSRHLQVQGCNDDRVIIMMQALANCSST
jgi:hypothetical protein